MIEMLAEYKKSRKGIDDMISLLGDTEYDKVDKKKLNSMHRDVTFIIDWIEKGSNPDEFRGIDIKSAYHIKYLSNMDILPDITEQIERKPIELTEERKRIIMKILSSWSDRERDCFILHETRDMSMQDIADQLGIKKTTVQNYIEKARKKINKVLEGTKGVRSPYC